jgi:hypothetical protein
MHTDTLPKNVVTGNFQIMPADINTLQHFFDAFDHNETEISANWLVRLAQDRGQGWDPFTADDIERFYRQDSRGTLTNFRFNRLIEPGVAFSIRTGHHLKGGGWIVKHTDGKYYFTMDFIQRCYKSRPANK